MSAWRAYRRDEPWRDRSSLFIVYEPAPGHRKPALVQSLVFKEQDEGAPFPDDPPSIDGSSRDINDFLREMMELAWKAGIRPNGLEDTQNEVKAIRDHLEDMRYLAKVRKEPRA